MSDCVQVAKQIRKELKEVFPYTKFSVRSSKYSMGSSITISWNNMPLNKEVKEVTDKYAEISYCEASGEILSGGNMYVSTSYNITNEFREECEKEITEEYDQNDYHDRLKYNDELEEIISNKYHEFLEDQTGKVLEYETIEIDLSMEQFQIDKTFIKSNDNTLYKLIAIEECKGSLQGLKVFTFMKLGKKLQELSKAINLYSDNLEQHLNNKSFTIVEVKTNEDNENPNNSIQTSTHNNSNLTAEYKYNEDKNGIELHFTDKPDEETRNLLKTNGFRWSKRGFWYTRHTDKKESFAKSLIDQLQSIEENEHTEPITAESFADHIQDYSMMIITELGADHFNDLTDSQYKDYKYKLKSIIDEKELTVNDDVINYLTSEGMNNLVNVLKDINSAEPAAPQPQEEQTIYNSEPTTTPEEQPKIEYTSDNKIKVKSIEFIWSESINIQENTIVSTFTEANNIIKSAAKNAPDNGAYDKTKFEITWTDNETYVGRVDIEKHYSLKDEPLTDHILEHCNFYVGLYRSSHLTEQEYNAIVAGEAKKEEFIDFMNTYQLHNENQNNSDNIQPDNIIDFKQVDDESNIDNIFNKFDDIEIQNNSRISSEDQTFCETQETIYRETIQFLETTLQQYIEIHEKYGERSYSSDRDPSGYISNYDDIRKIENRIKEIKNDFISRICSYFSENYNVTIEKGELYEKYTTEVTYNNIIDEIFEQLDGFSFEEKAVNELKENMRSQIYRYEKVKVNKNKLTITDYIYWDSWATWDGTKLSWSDQKVNTLFKALSHFENNETEMMYMFNVIHKQLSEGSKQHDILSKYTINYNKIKSFKTYKNGRVDIEFYNNSQAQQFCNEYLNYPNAA
ncbi:LPD29 domain-containing protein [Chengkuizengella marina]|uniref:Uncharacterized protein n=1 Tax=Chengkuizengella marina TaxID=2507566 RepID=A0A6N9Q0D5_9BACL|nr:LPD29 domain-containing protein [Chengkuizengella marina]NBI28636.1 hypothetical protein [Chengkuizengella marina]